mmetsp:Transcript_37758/g.116670  ORF Transcript_37758/g.116670 Transcript_37758/m.116670 type:complete len:356 (+) Transcript_37758:256-1323(+)
MDPRERCQLHRRRGGPGARPARRQGADVRGRPRARHRCAARRVQVPPVRAGDARVVQALLGVRQVRAGVRPPLPLAEPLRRRAQLLALLALPRQHLLPPDATVLPRVVFVHRNRAGLRQLPRPRRARLRRHVQRRFDRARGLHLVHRRAAARRRHRLGAALLPPHRAQHPRDHDLRPDPHQAPRLGGAEARAGGLGLAGAAVADVSRAHGVAAAARARACRAAVARGAAAARGGNGGSQGQQREQVSHGGRALLAGRERYGRALARVWNGIRPPSAASPPPRCGGRLRAVAQHHDPAQRPLQRAVGRRRGNAAADQFPAVGPRVRAGDAAQPGHDGGATPAARAAAAALAVRRAG